MAEDDDFATQRIAAISRQLSPSRFATSTSVIVSRELSQERQTSTFATRSMTLFLDGGAANTKFREQTMALLTKFPEFAVGPATYEMTRDQQRELTLRKVRRMHQFLVRFANDRAKHNMLIELFALHDLSWWVRHGVQFALFCGALASQTSPEQRQAWLEKSKRLEVYGSFGMTELGHGSYTRGVETTAIYDQSTDEFIINTPTDTATKWWIGAAGETATHTICFAQLIVDGESKGVQSFLVPLRDSQTHEPLPGIHIGDCGAKMGINGVDNGWIQFENVRVPRFNMLCRYAQVTREGEFIQHHKAQMTYSALVGTRGLLVMTSINALKKALTITVRYCAIRRQGIQVNSLDASSESKLLDYQSHQYRLMPLLAKAYTYHLQISNIQTLVAKFNERGGGLPLANVADIHATMAGMKAFSTWDTLRAIEECRQCCGGQGYSSYNGLAPMLSDFSVMVTFEGDNTVMALQTAHYVIHSVDRMMNREKLSGSVQYLERLADNRHWELTTAEELDQPRLLSQAVNFLAGKRGMLTAMRLFAAQKKMNSKEEAWNNCHVDLLETARVHVIFNVATGLLDQIEKLKSTSDSVCQPHQVSDTNSLVRVLQDLCTLFVLYELDHSAGFLLKEGFMTAHQSDLVHHGVLEFCRRVRKNGVALVDAFNFSDEVLNSCIGRYDGNIYEALLSVVEPQSKPCAYFASQVQPMLRGAKL